MLAISVRTAFRASAAALLALAATPSPAPAERWLRPVPGNVARAFSYTRAVPFAAGAHRGADLAAPPGTAVRAACAGHVLHAGPVAGEDVVVSVRCGSRRVSYLPLASVTVRAGSSVRAGAPLGSLAAGHDGLHLGVRRERDPFGYEDPAALLASTPRVVPVAPPGGRPRGRAPRAHRPRTAPPPAQRVPLPESSRIARRSPLAAPPPAATAPAAAWAGLALVLTGATGSGTAIAVRRRRQRRRAVASTAAPA